MYGLKDPLDQGDPPYVATFQLLIHLAPQFIHFPGENGHNRRSQFSVPVNTLG